MSEKDIGTWMAIQEELLAEEELLVGMLKEIDNQLIKLQVEQLQLVNAATEQAPAVQSSSVANDPLELQTMVNQETLDLTVPVCMEHEEEEEEDAERENKMLKLYEELESFPE